MKIFMILTFLMTLQWIRRDNQDTPVNVTPAPWWLSLPHRGKHHLEDLAHFSNRVQRTAINIAGAATFVLHCQQALRWTAGYFRRRYTHPAQ